MSYLLVSKMTGAVMASAEFTDHQDAVEWHKRLAPDSCILQWDGSECRYWDVCEQVE